MKSTEAPTTPPWQTLLAIDFDKWAARTYAANFPGVQVECASVADWIDRMPYADAFTLGPPCQPHSHAGKRLASADARDCGPDAIAAIRKAQPRHFLLENVDGLLTSENGRYFHRLYASMEDAGYVVKYEVQDAVGFGVPQFRNRLWCWGIRKDLYAAGMRHQFPKPTHAWPPPDGCMFGAALLPGVTVGQALGIEWWATECNTSSGMAKVPRSGSQPCTTVSGGGNTLGGLLAVEYDHGIAVANKPSPTLKSGGNYDASGKQGGGCPPVLRLDDPKHPVNVLDRPAVTQRGGGAGHGPPDHTIILMDGVRYRRLTPDECAVLQSAPATFAWPEGITKTNKHRIIGNGWACGHGAAFSRAIAAVDPEARTMIDLYCGGGLGAVGWHQRFWSYAPAEVEAA